MLFQMVLKQKDGKFKTGYSFRVMLFQMVLKLYKDRENEVIRFRVMLFQMVLKHGSKPEEYLYLFQSYVILDGIKTQ